MASLAVDAFAFVDGDDALLVPGVESGATELYGGWFPPAAMAEIAQAMGVEVREDRVASWRDLNLRYAGLISGSRTWERLARSGGVTFSALGILTISLGVLGIVLGIVTRTPAAAAVAGLVALPLGMSFLHVARRLLRGVDHRRGTKQEQANGPRRP